MKQTVIDNNSSHWQQQKVHFHKVQQEKYLVVNKTIYSYILDSYRKPVIAITDV